MKNFAVAAGALSLMAMMASGASAAPGTGIGAAVSNDGAGIVKVHGIHRACVEGRYGWHRSPFWGVRKPCDPRWRRDHDDDHREHHDRRRDRDHDRH